MMSSDPLQSGDKAMHTAIEPESDAQTVLNLRATLDRLGGDMALLQDVAQIVVEDAEVLLLEIEEALKNEQPDRAALSAHSLKGLVSNFNAEFCAAAAKAVEQAGRAGDLPAVQRSLDSLRREVDRLVTALKQEVLR